MFTLRSGRSSAPFFRAPAVVLTGFQKPTPVRFTVAPSGCHVVGAAPHLLRTEFRVAMICARPRVVDGRHDGLGRYAFMYVEEGTSKSWKASSPFDWIRHAWSTVEKPQTCFWNELLRAVVIFFGAVSLAMSVMLVAAGVQCTDDLPVSLSVIIFQSVPPHCGPGAASTCALAGAAKAAVSAASAAAAARTNRIARTSRVSIDRKSVV